MKIPKFIILDMMYRDGGNYKTCETWTVTNNLHFTETEIKEAFDKFAEMYPDKSVIAQYYDLPDMGQVKSEFFQSSNEVDHSYTELCEWKFSDVEEDQLHDKDISDIIKMINSPEMVKERRQAEKEWAIKELQEQIISIQKINI